MRNVTSQDLTRIC